jgi:hypothetical protein
MDSCAITSQPSPSRRRRAAARSPAQVAQMMDDAAIRYLQRADAPTDKPKPIQRRLVASLVLPKGLESENVRSASVYAAVTKWRA